MMQERSKLGSHSTWRLLRAFQAFSARTGKLASFLIPLMMFIMTYEVVARYVLHSPTIWVMETSQYLFLATTALGGAYLLSQKKHVNVSILYGRLSLRMKAAVDAVTALFFFFFMGALLRSTWTSTVEAVIHLEHSPTYWEPPLYPVYIVMTFGITLTLLQGVVQLISNCVTAVTGRKPLAGTVEEVGGDEPL